MGVFCDRNFWIGVGGKEREQWEEMDRFFKKLYRNLDMLFCSGKFLFSMRIIVLVCVCSGCYYYLFDFGVGRSE